MDSSSVQSVKAQFDFEYARTQPPEGFPELPLIPGGRYISDAFFEAEKKHLWSNSWLYAAHAFELPRVGSTKLWTDAGVPVILVRDDNDNVRAYYNTCQHRGGPLVTEEYSDNQRLQCGYHGWAYNYNGDLIGVPDRRDFVNFDQTCHSLVELRCETWGRWIFVNLNDQATPLLESIGKPLLQDFAQFDIDNLHLFKKYSIPIAANWKICTDAFMEVYHLQHIHPETVNQLLDHKGTVISLLENGNTRMISPNRDGYLPPDEGLADIASVGEVARLSNLAVGLFPNLISPLHSQGFPFLQFWPIDKRNTRMDIMWFGPGDGVNDENSQPWRDPENRLTAQWLEKLAIFDLVLQEDTQFLPWQQQSIETGALQGIPLSYQERRIYFQHETIDVAIGSENIPSGQAVQPVLSSYVEK